MLDLTHACAFPFFSMNAIHYYQCPILIRRLGAHEFDNKLIFTSKNQIIILFYFKPKL